MTSIGGHLALAACLAAGFVAFYLSAATPAPRSARIPDAEFSAVRAFTDIRAIASTPHPIGSAAHEQVRDYLIGRMTALGLSPRVASADSFEARGHLITGGRVTNLIGILKGRDPKAPALALMAHYDSVPGSPGAADDAAGVASILETVRTLKTHGAPKRDVLVVLTDGEEAGLLGAQAFFNTDPAAAHVGYIINLETRGGGGRAAMFETAGDNGGDIEAFTKAAKRPDSNSLSVYIYKHLPNDTDFTVAKQHGKVGLNFAFIGRQFDYHSPSSTPEALDLGSVQHMGDEVAPTALALAMGPLPTRAPDVAYSDVFGLTTISYPPAVGWAVVLATAVLIVVGAAGARRAGPFSLLDILRGCGTSVYVIALSGALLILARRATGVGVGFVAYRPLLARFPTFEVMMLCAALAALLFAVGFSARGRSRRLAGGLALGAGAAASVFGGFDPVGLGFGVVGLAAGLVIFDRPAGPAATWTGLLLMALMAASAIQLVAPTAAVVFVWPVAVAALASALSGAGASRSRVVKALVFLLAASVFAWLGNIFHLMMEGLDLAVLGVAPAWLAVLMIWPMARSGGPGDPGVKAGAALAVAAAVLAAYLHLTNPWTARHPQTAEPVYVASPADGRAWRASLVPPDAWARGVLCAEGGSIAPLNLSPLGDAVAAAPAALAHVSPASASLSRLPDGGTVLAMAPNADASRVIFSITARTPVDAVAIDGRPVVTTPRDGTAAPFHLAAGETGYVIWRAGAGLSMTFKTADPTSLTVRTIFVSPRWLAAKPVGPYPLAEQPWDLAGSSLILGAVKAPQP